MDRSELVERYFGRSDESVEPYHQAHVQHGLKTHHNTVSQVRGGHTSGNETIFYRVLADKIRQVDVTEKDILYAKMVEVGQEKTVRLTIPKYPDKYATNGYTRRVAEILKVLDTRNVTEAWQAQRLEYLLETPDDDPDFHTEVRRFLDAQSRPASFHAAKMWAEFEAGWDKTRRGFYLFLYGIENEDDEANKTSGRKIASFAPSEASIFSKFRKDRLDRIEAGEVVLPTLLDHIVLEGYFRDYMVSEGVIEYLRSKSPVRITDETIRTHLRSIAYGDINDRINHTERRARINNPLVED